MHRAGQGFAVTNCSTVLHLCMVCADEGFLVNPTSFMLALIEMNRQRLIRHERLATTAIIKVRRLATSSTTDFSFLVNSYVGKSSIEQ